MHVDIHTQQYTQVNEVFLRKGGGNGMPVRPSLAGIANEWRLLFLADGKREGKEGGQLDAQGSTFEVMGSRSFSSHAEATEEEEA